MGTESSLFTRGIVPGRTTDRRIAHIRQAGLRTGPYAEELQAFLAQAAERVRKVFHGPLTYASLPFEVLDWSMLVRPRLKKGTHVRDEEHQARELTKTLGTSTSLVKTYERGHGTTYPGLPWEPKQAFSAVASFYATH